MSSVVCFGEIIWDVLPQGRFLGGAPLNVAYHLRRLGRQPCLVSAVGADPLGDEALEKLNRAGLATNAVTRHPTLPTGTVAVQLSDAGQASYTIHRPVAWDEITVIPRADEAPPAALVYGSLALRGRANRVSLSAWLRAKPVLRVCDLNLRPPFDDLSELGAFIRGCSLLKVNHDEARRLVPPPIAAADAETHATQLMETFACEAVCITLGAEGALVRHAGKTHRASAPPVTVCDTIGAGDAFTAALLDGLLRGAAEARIDWNTLLRRACALGAYVASRSGAQPEYAPAEVPGL
jgi:fructokinase